uniref:Uncharacterized protein n=1 Tax=Vespula pensylvanica TaxID=30213 RepID=A0A834NZW8_VESPE|nr:hypothetical protein H0235_008533 [Vespula pensylvanica]
MVGEPFACRAKLDNELLGKASPADRRPTMSSLQVPELRLPAGDGGGGAGSGTGSKGTAPLLLVPPSNVPRRRHSWICR